MKFLALVAGIAGGFFGGNYAFPRVAPRLGLILGEGDLLVLTPIAKGKLEASPVAGTPVKLVVDSLSGKAQRLGAEAEWTAVARGDEIGDSEHLRTEAGSSLELVAADGDIQLELADASQIAILSVSTALVRGRLAAGWMAVTTGHGARFAFASKSGRTVAEGAGKVMLLADGDRFGARCASGALTISAQGKSTDVPSGQTAQLSEGSQPKVVVESEKIDLQVEPVGAVPAGAKSVTVRGRASGFVRVTVAGVAAPRDGKGEFSVKVPVKPGPNTLSVRATGVWGGRKETAVGPFEVTASAAAAVTPPVAGERRRPPKPKGEGMQWGAP